MRKPVRWLCAAAVGTLLLATGCAPLQPHARHTRGAHYDPYYDARDPYLHHWHRTSSTHFARHRFLTRHGVQHRGLRGHRGHCGH